MSKLKNIVDSLNDYEYAESFNLETTLEDDTKLLIVGTLTPPEGRNKYFYSTNCNKIYGLIDRALNNGGKLEELKDKFYCCSSNKKEVREEIKEYLIENKIAFLDVIKKAIRNKYSSDDEEIIVSELDYDAFKDLKNVKKIIVNSRAAEDALKRIFNKNFGDPEIYNEKVIYLSQNRRGFSEEKWINAIRKALDIQS